MYRKIVWKIWAVGKNYCARHHRLPLAALGVSIIPFSFSVFGTHSVACVLHKKTSLKTLGLPHVAEKVHHPSVHDQEDTAARAETENLGNKALVQSAEPFLLGDGGDAGPGPVVLWRLAGDLDGVLDPGLDDVHGGVEDGADGAADGAGDDVVCHLALLRLGLWDELADLEDAAKVAGVPEDVAPEGGLEAVVHGEDALVADRLQDDVDHAVVPAGRGLVLEADLDELEGDDDEGLGGAGGGAGEDGEGLGHLGLAEELTVELAPLVVGGELGGALGGLHEDGGGDAAVEAGEAGERGEC